MLFMDYEGLHTSLTVTPDSYSYSISITSIAIIIVFVLGGLGSALHIVIGQKAIALSRGKRCGNFTLFLAGFFVLFSIFILTFAMITYDEENVLDYVLSYLVGLTEDALLIEVIVFSLRLKRRMK